MRNRSAPPELALGTAPLGCGPAIFGRAVDEATAIATIEACLAAGIRCFDTAPLYGNGLAEQRLGQALRGVPRQELRLCTKVGWLPDGAGSEGGIRSYTREHVQRSVDQSLARMHTDYLDVVHVHDPDLGDYERDVFDQAFPLLQELLAAGVIRAIGAGMNQCRPLIEYLQRAPVRCILLAGRYTLLDQEAAAELLPLVEAKGVELFLGGVFNSGILATGAIEGARYQYGAASAAVRERATAITALGQVHGVSLRHAALHFAAAHPAVRTVVLGMADPREVTENLAAWRQPIPPAYWSSLQRAGLIPEQLPVPS